VNSWGFTSATWDANDGKTVACSWTKNKRELREWGFDVENNDELVSWTGPWDFVPNASLRAIEPRFLTDLVDKDAACMKKFANLGVQHRRLVTEELGLSAEQWDSGLYRLTSNLTCTARASCCIRSLTHLPNCSSGDLKKSKKGILNTEGSVRTMFKELGFTYEDSTIPTYWTGPRLLYIEAWCQFIPEGASYVTDSFTVSILQALGTTRAVEVRLITTSS
jgi:hypothetical protein